MRYFFLIILSFSTLGHAEEWTITTVEWAPYTCQNCPEQGAAIKILREALKTEGITVKVIFLPWSRAMKDVLLKHADGYYPAWVEDLFEGTVASLPVFKSPVGFVERRSEPLKWQELEDLKTKNIGTVIDYGNTKALNYLIKTHVINSELVKDDETNIRKVAGGRIDAAFIDLVNAEYLLAHMDAPTITKVQINPRVLEEKNLYLIMRLDSKDKVALFNRALGKMNSQRVVDDYIKAMGIRQKPRFPLNN